MRVVLDANVLISGLLSPKGPPGQILNAWLEGQFELCLSSLILQELQRVLEYPHISRKLEPAQVQRLLSVLTGCSLQVKGALTLNILKLDPADNIYLACAVEAQANYLVSGNFSHFVEAGPIFRGTQILTPRQFLDLISHGK